MGGEPEVNQVDSISVVVTDQNVLCLDIVMKEIHLVKHSDALNLDSKQRVKLGAFVKPK